MQARAFNKITVNYEKGFLIKSSSQKIKIKDEINYYLNIPKNIARLFPKLIDYPLDYSSYKMEYIPYENLATLIVEDKISLKEGKNILQNILNVFDKVHVGKPHLDNFPNNSIFDFYIKKTFDRIEDLKSNPQFEGIINNEYIWINNKKYKTFKTLKNFFIKNIKNFLSKYPTISIIHGDFCFSNILYCPKIKDIKIIDPRGSFGEKGIFGHTYYDYAKVMQCLNGCYDYIVNEKYEFSQTNDNVFIFQKHPSPLLDALHTFYQEKLIEKNIDIKFLYFIEASLFLSMAALHYDCSKRQKALYLTGIIILNKLYENQNENLH